MKTPRSLIVFSRYENTVEHFKTPEVSRLRPAEHLSNTCDCAGLPLWNLHRSRLTLAAVPFLLPLNRDTASCHTVRRNMVGSALADASARAARGQKTPQPTGKENVSPAPGGLRFSFLLDRLLSHSTERGEWGVSLCSWFCFNVHLLVLQLMKLIQRFWLILLYPLFWCLDLGIVLSGVSTWRDARRESKDVFRRIWNEEP